MKKVYFYGLALSFCAANSYAQQTIGSFADLQAAKDSVAKISTYQTNLQETKTQYNSLLNGAMNIKPTETTTRTEYYAKGSAEKNAVQTYYNAVRNEVSSSNAKLRISRIVTGGLFSGTQLYVYSPDQVVDSSIDVIELTVNEAWTETSTIISNGSKITDITFYVKDKDGKYEEVVCPVTTKPVYDVDVLPALMSASNSIQEKDEAIEVTETVKNDSYLNAQSMLAANETRQNYINAALNGGTWTIKTVAWNEAGTDVDVVEKVSEFSFPGCINYKNLKLASDITISDANFTMGNMAEDYSFDGAGNTVTGNNNTLFGSNNGEISNVKLNGCNLVSTNNGTISNVEVNGGEIFSVINKGTIKNSIANTSGSSYKVYGSDGSSATVDGSDVSNYNKIYNNVVLREEFGIDVVNGTVLRGSEYRLYEVKQYSSNNKAGETRLANIDGNGNIKIKNSWTKTGIGEFYYVSNSDAGKLFDGIDASNIAKNIVYTRDGNKWECKVAEVSDTENAIYVPSSFVAEKATYSRKFAVAAEGAGTICLPFNVDRTKLNDILGAEGKLLQFNKIDDNASTYWFKYVTGGMEANQPYILKFGQNVNGELFNNFENVEFVATGETQNLAALSQSSVAAGASLFGTFEKRNASELEDGARYSIFGFSAKTGKFVRMTEQIAFLPTRAYVRQDGWTDPKAPSSAKSYKLGILDENDNDVTAISSVEKAADKFSVKGGNGVITVNADKAQNVKVYTAGGALVKNADVVAGETSIPVSAGMYIVNGNKVVVK